MLVRYYIYPVLVPTGFGLSRWMSGFVDIIGLPALIPIIVCLLFVAFKKLSATVDYAGFALLWLAPMAVVQAFSENASPSPIPLMLVPLLWAAQVIGISFFINCIVHKPRWYIIIPSAMGIGAVPIAAVTSWWAFFGQMNFMGTGLLLVILVPALIPFLQKREEKELIHGADDMPELTMCGYRCDLCKAFSQCIEKKDERDELSAAWKKYYALDIPAERIYCDGCKCKKPDAQRLDSECPVRTCVINKGVIHCGKCDEYPCDTFKLRKGLSFDEAKQKLGENFDPNEYEQYLRAYDNQNNLNKIRN